MLVQANLNQKVNRSLDEVLASLTGDFFIVTKKAVVGKEEVKAFVNEARAKRMNDFNIATLIKAESGFLSSYLK